VYAHEVLAHGSGPSPPPLGGVVRELESSGREGKQRPQREGERGIEEGGEGKRKDRERNIQDEDTSKREQNERTGGAAPGVWHEGDSFALFVIFGEG